jgi:hypothetical protein
MSEKIKGSCLLTKPQKLIGSNIIRVDELLGLRGWGLIFYGVLPSNLALLGILDTKLPDIDKISIILILVASIIPLFFIFVLIRSQNKNWYITKDRFNIRSLTITFLIIILSTLIVEISGVIHKKYVLCMPWDIETLNSSAECFLLAISSLVLSSSIFILVLTQKTNFPLLPPISFVESMCKIEKNLRMIKDDEIWYNFKDVDDSLANLVEETKNELYDVIISNGNNLAKMSLKQNYEDLINLANVLKKIQIDRGKKSKKIHWEIYFCHSQYLSPDRYIRRSEEEEAFNSLERLRNLELGD